MIEVSRIIQTLVAPVVMISACGLLCLALYNRLAVVVGRTRGFLRERIETSERMAELPNPGATHVAINSSERQLITRRVAMLDEQVSHVLARARLLRNCLVCLIVSILAMLACTLCLGLTLVVAGANNVALALFIAGVLAMMAGMVLALMELRSSLDPVALEYEAVKEMDGPEERV